MVNGVVYIQDLDANVYALALATGKLKWEYQLKIQYPSGPDSGGEAVGLGSGGLETPLVSSDGSVTFGTGNPYQSVASAIAQPSTRRCGARCA